MEELTNSASKSVFVAVFWSGTGGFRLVKFGTESNNELTQKYEKVKVQNDLRTSELY